MGDLNISRQFAQRLGDDTSRRLVQEILQDKTVTSDDQAKLDELKKHLESAPTVPGDEDAKKELINSLSDLHTFMGVNLGTDKTILEANLKRLQSFQDSMQPNEVNFDGMQITTDGWLGDTNRVLRLRDLEPTGDVPAQTPGAPVPADSAAPVAAPEPVTGDPPVTGPNTPAVPVESVNPSPTGIDNAFIAKPPIGLTNRYIPQASYTPSTAPAVKPPQLAVPSNMTPEQQTALATTQTAYTQSVTTLQTQTMEMRNLLNDPQAVSDVQLRASLSSLVENDSGKGFLELLRFNPNLLNDLKTKGLISEADRTNLYVSLNGIVENKELLEAGNKKSEDLSKQIQELESKLVGEGSLTDAGERTKVQDQITALKSQLSEQQSANSSLQTSIDTAIDKITSGDMKLKDGNSAKTVLTGYLSQTPSPISDAQVNAYRAGLVKSADDYLANPNAATYSDLKSNLYSNMYVFEKGVSATQEQSYVKFKEAVLDTSQKESNLTHQLDALTGKTSALENVQAGEDLAYKLQAQKEGAASSVDAFIQKGDAIVTYLKTYPGQYPEQATDTAALEAKLKALKASTNPQEQLTLLNQVSSALDEAYIKTNISQGASPDQSSTTQALLDARKTMTSPEDQKKLDLLINNPELVRLLPKVGDYAAIATHLSGKTYLTPQEKELKAAIESGDSAKVNAIFTADMFSNFGFGSLALGGSYFSGFGLGSSLFYSPALPPIEQDMSLVPKDNELNFGTGGATDFQLDTPSLTPSMSGAFSSSSTSSTLFSPTLSLNQPPLTFASYPPPPPLWLSVPGGSSRAAALAEELAAMPEDRRKSVVAALQSPEMADMPAFIQRISQEQPDLAQQLGKVQIAEAGREAINAGHWDNSSLLNAAQTSLQNQIQTNQAVQAEFTLAKKDLEQMVKNPDLSGPVKAKLQAQLDSVNGALSAIGAGKFPPEDPAEQAKLDSVLKALSTEQKPQGLKLSDRLMHQATLEVLADMQANPAGMQKLQTMDSLKGLTEVFAKEGDQFTFPQEMIDLLGKEDLSPEAAQMLMLQVGRISHLAKSAETLSTGELERRFKLGDKMLAAGDGSGEMSSGKDSLISLNSFKENINAISAASSSGAKIDSVTWLNNMAKQVGPLDLTKENKEMRAAVNTAFQDNVSMVKNMAEEKINTLTDKQSKTNITTGQSTLSGMLVTPEMRAMLEPAIKANIITEDDLTNIDAAKLTKIKTAIESVKASMSTKEGLANPEVQAKLAQLDKLSDVRQKVEDLLTTEASAKTDMLLMIDQSKKEYLTGMTEFRDQLKAQGISTPQLDQFIANPNSVAFQSVLDELQTLTAGGSSEVQALGNGLKALVTNVQTIAMAQTAIANNDFKEPEKAALIAAIGSGTRIREFMAEFIRTGSTESGANKFNVDMQHLADRIEAAGDSSADMVAAVSHGKDVVGVSGGAPIPVPPLGRLVQGLNALTDVQDQMHNSGLVPTSVSLQEIGVSGFNPPDAGNWYPGKFIQQIASNIRERGNIIASTPPDQLASVLNVYNRVDQLSARADNTFMKGIEGYLKEVNPAMQAAGLPGVDLSFIDDSEPMSGDPVFGGKANLSQGSQALVDKADELANAILSPKPGMDGKAALSDLLKEFLDNIRNLDFETRKIVMAQFAKRLLNNMITKMYDEKNRENAKYHEKNLDQFKARMKEGVEKSVAAAEAKAASGQAVMAVAGQLGAQAGAAIDSASGISDQSLRDDFSQFLEPAVQDGVLSRVQKQKLLQALFEGSSVTGQEGLMSIMNRFQQMSSIIAQ